VCIVRCHIDRSSRAHLGITGPDDDAATGNIGRKAMDTSGEVCRIQ